MEFKNCNAVFNQKLAAIAQHIPAHVEQGPASPLLLSPSQSAHKFALRGLYYVCHYFTSHFLALFS